MDENQTQGTLDPSALEEVYDEAGTLIGFRPVAQEGQGETPAQAAAVAEDDDPSFASEAGRAVMGGLRDGAQEIANTFQHFGGKAIRGMTGGSDIYYTKNDGFEWLTEEEVLQRDDIPEWQRTPIMGDGGTLDLPEVAENETVVGGISRSIVQFVAPYAALGKATKAGMATSKLAAGASALGRGAAVDFSAFSAHEERLSDFLRDNAGLNDPVTEYLSADEDDTVLEGKLKNAIEGAALGVATDSVFYLIKSLKKAKAIELKEGPEAASEFMEKQAAEAPDEIQLELFDGTTDPNIRDAAPEPAEASGTKAEVAVVDEVAEEAARIEKAKPAVNTENLTSALEAEGALRRAGSYPDPEREVVGDLFNMEYMDSDVDIKDVLNMASEDIKAFGVKDKTTFDAITADARSFVEEAIDVSPENFDASLARMAQDAEKQQGIVIAGKQMIQSFSREVERLADQIDAGNATEADMAKFVRMQQRLIETSANLKSVITGAAQTTAAGRIRTVDGVTGQQLANIDITNQLDAIIESGGGTDAILDLARAVKLNKEAGGGAQSLIRIAETGNRSLFNRGMRVANEVFINSILSGPKTHVINILSNALNTVALPAEAVMGGVMKADFATAKQGLSQFVGVWSALNDSFKMTAAAFRQGRNYLDPEAAILEANGVDFNAITSSSNNPVVRNVVNGLGTTIRLPSRFLMAGDEFFKQINYRADLYARLTSEAADMVAAGKIEKKDVAKYVADRVATGINDAGAATSQASLDFAREATFTQELTKNTAFRDVQNFTNKHPLAKMVIPFVRTPTNILKAAVQRTPVLHMASSSMRAALQSAEPKVAAAARGKRATGSMLWSMAVIGAANGNITGSGPADPAARARLMETGWRPYSFKVEQPDGGIKYVEYRRIEPVAMFLGIAADVADISGSASEAQMDEIAIASAVGLVNNIASKTFLQGLIDVVEVASDPKRHMASYLRRQSSAMVPFSALRREVRKVDDPALREVRSIVDAIKDTIPGYSQTLPARRSWITGEPLLYSKGWGADMLTPVGEAMAAANPITAGEWAQDPVLDEMARLGHAFSAPSRKFEDIELNTEQYSRFNELNGTVRINRRTMYQELERLFASRQYDKERQFYGDDPDPSQNSRVLAVQKVISAYRSKAKQELMREYPELIEHTIKRRSAIQRDRRSVYSGITQLAE